jgi:hypothetical protein
MQTSKNPDPYEAVVALMEAEAPADDEPNTDEADQPNMVMVTIRVSRRLRNSLKILTLNRDETMQRFVFRAILREVSRIKVEERGGSTSD